VATSFRMPFQVLKRNIGYWANGVYQLDDDAGTMITVMATVQMPSQASDLMAIQASPFGRRAGRFIKIYSDTRLNCVAQEIEGLRAANAGDIFFYDDSQYLVFGETDFTMLSRSRATPVSHWRYYACEAIEAFVAEHAP
jgi:hypothetical protein